MKNFSSKIQSQFHEMCKTGKLFRVELSGQEVWDLYISSFGEGDDPVFRDPTSTTHNCNHCRHFIRRYGNIVAIDENLNLMSIFDVDISGIYENVAKKLSSAIRSSKIANAFFETFNDLRTLNYGEVKKSFSVFRLGVAKNVKRYTREEAELYGVVKPNELREFHHMHMNLPARFVDKSGNSIESIMGYHRDNAHVFARAMKEIPLETLELVRDLISQGSLLNGDAHLFKVEEMITLKKEYNTIDSTKKENWIWLKSRDNDRARFKNELIGVLCSELAQGENLNSACRNWNKRVDPVNYMKATAPITQKQIEEAARFVSENGYTESFNRRLATIDDIKASEIHHVNSGNGTIKEVSLFDDVKPTKHQHSRNRFDNVEEVSIEKFMKDILPTCSSVEVFLKNSHEKNMVTLTTSAQEDSKRIFKWDNNYSWTYSGNLAGKSEIKEAVKSQGGGVDGVLRFSIMWSENNNDNSDLDAHCLEPDDCRIYYVNKLSRRTGGHLDIDIQFPEDHKSYRKGKVVENITYPSLDRMVDGTYNFLVHQYAARGSKGFRAEVEFNDEIYSYSYDSPVRGFVRVANVTLKDGKFSIQHELPEKAATREIYGLQSNSFHQVNLICLSPNHWGANQTGNKHFFFMLEGCKAPGQIRSFHNENLNGDLLKHRKVMEVLGSTRMIKSSKDQLSGLGFNATVRDELIVRLKGNFQRVVKIKF